MKAFLEFLNIIKDETLEYQSKGLQGFRASALGWVDEPKSGPEMISEAPSLISIEDPVKNAFIKLLICCVFPAGLLMKGLIA